MIFWLTILVSSHNEKMQHLTAVTFQVFHSQASLAKVTFFSCIIKKNCLNWCVKTWRGGGKKIEFSRCLKCLIGPSTTIVAWTASQSPELVCLNQINPSIEAGHWNCRPPVRWSGQPRGWSLHRINKNNEEQNNSAGFPTNRAFILCRQAGFCYHVASNIYKLSFKNADLVKSYTDIYWKY